MNMNMMNMMNMTNMMIMMNMMNMMNMRPSRVLQVAKVVRDIGGGPVLGRSNVYTWRTRQVSELFSLRHRELFSIKMAVHAQLRPGLPRGHDGGPATGLAGRVHLDLDGLDTCGLVH